MIIAENAQTPAMQKLYIYVEKIIPHELVERLLQDRNFYERSGGGVTISGGEALCQIDFVEEVLKRLKEENINTALDTTGYAEWEVLSRTMPYVDLYLYDLKHMDSKKHEEVVKVPNEKILANAKKLAENGKNYKFVFRSFRYLIMMKKISERRQNFVKN